MRPLGVATGDGGNCSNRNDRSPDSRGLHTAGRRAEDIWDKKYRLKTKKGEPVDASIDDTYQRVARALADAESSPKNKSTGTSASCGRCAAARFRPGASPPTPARRSTSPPPRRSTAPSPAPSDSMDDILDKVHEAGLTLKAGCGIGYEFSTLRPRGAFVAGAGAYTSGPMSFMDIYDKMCFTVSSAGGRRGAQMGTFDVSHPDVKDFIRAKREDGRLRQFNLSLLITDDFMQAVEARRRLAAGLPGQPKGGRTKSTSTDPARLSGANGRAQANYVTRDDGLVACKIYGHPRTHLWDMIMVSTYDYAEPGFILIDRVNEMNNNWWCENIRATNPCGEQPLPPYGACLLGSINLTTFVRDPFTDKARFDWDEYREVVRVFTRMLDNVVEVNGLPLQQQREEIMHKRRHGMGFLGLGSR
jgi:ribonucleoside-diphosphate reductase alpha chain